MPYQPGFAERRGIIINFFKKHIVTGLLALLPIMGTIWVLTLVYNFFADVNVEFIERELGFKVPGLQIIFSLFVLFLIGFIVNTSIGRWVLKNSELLISKLPVVKGVYGGIKQLTDTLTARSEEDEARVVLVEYPRRGIWQLGFVTNDAWKVMRVKSGEELVNVLMPTSPNPTGGMLILIPKKDIIPLDMSYNDGMKYVVSGGVVTPDEMKRQNKLKKL